MKIIYGLSIATLLLLSSSANAADKVVVVPLGDNPSVRIYYGSVQTTGELETGNAVGSVRNSEGNYTINVGGPVGGCAATVSKGSQAGGASNIYGNVTVSISSAGNTFTVRTRDSSGTSDDTDFHFIMICPL